MPDFQLGARTAARRPRATRQFVCADREIPGVSVGICTQIMEDGPADTGADVEGLIAGEDFPAKRASSFVRIGKSMSGERNSGYPLKRYDVLFYFFSKEVRHERLKSGYRKACSLSVDVGLIPA
jgi:hypothetical protein